MKQLQPVSIVVPTLNEADNMSLLVKRIDMSLSGAAIPYEIVVVDDHSSDDTLLMVRHLEQDYPVRAISKRGKRGKAYSLLEGFEETRYQLVAMIDADLQYAPEELVAMHRLLEENDADVVITQRTSKQVSPLRKLSTKIYNLIFARLLFGISFDTQSGLKLFKKSVLENIEMDPSPWTFDLEFLVRALENRFKIISHDIVFEERRFGVTKIKLLSATLEMIKASVLLRLRTSFRKIRAGKRANTRFLKQAFPTAVIVLAVAASLLTINPSKASAAGIGTGVVPGQNMAATLFDGLRDLVSGTLHPEDAPGKADDSVKDQPKASIQPATTVTGQTPSAFSTPAAQVAAATTNGTGQQATGNAGTAPTADKSKLSAATAPSNKAGIYASGYPSYRLSSNQTKQLGTVGAIALTAGGFCVIVATLIGTGRLIVHNKVRQAVRS